jgi:hypothetical protein
MNQSHSIGMPASNAPASATVTDHLNFLVNETSELVERMRALVNRVSGIVPREVTTGEAARQQQPTLMSLAHDARGRLQLLREEIDRLDTAV